MSATPTGDRVQRDRGTDELGERLGVELIALMEIDSPAQVPVEAGVEDVVGGRYRPIR
jgi:hypothetical protein